MDTVEEKGPRIKVMYGEAPVLFPPSLAILVGVDAAIILQKIEFLCEGQNSGREINGQRWIWNTYDQWRDDHFPWWTSKVIKDKIRLLEKVGYILSCQPDGAMSRKKYYMVSPAFKNLAHKEQAQEILTKRRSKEVTIPDGTKLSVRRTKSSDGRTELSVPKHRRLIKEDLSKEDLKLKPKVENEWKKDIEDVVSSVSQFSAP